MENSSGLLKPLASPALMVLASTAEAACSTSSPCQQPHAFGVPVTLEKPTQLPFLGTSYSLAAMYHHSERLAGTVSSRDYRPQLLPLHPQFAHPTLDRNGILGYSPLHPFQPFPLPEEMENFQPTFLATKRPKTLLTGEPPQIRYLALEKELEKHRAQLAAGSVGKFELTGLNPGSSLSSNKRTPSPRQSTHKKEDRTFEPFVVSPRCPLCDKELQRWELEEHLQHEIESLDVICPSETDTSQDASSQLRAKSPPQTSSLKEEPVSPAEPPILAEEGRKLDRHQVFMQVKQNREARLGARAGRIKKNRSHEDDQLDISLSQGPRLGETEDELSEGSRSEEWEYRSPQKGNLNLPEPKESLASTPRSVTTSRESDVDADTDREELLYYKHTTLEPNHLLIEETREKMTPSLDAPHKSYRATGSEDEATAVLARLRARIEELTQRLRHRDAYKCHVCLGAYSVPLTSIHCWHIHCERCWLRSLNTKKVCPQCSAMTSPADLRRVYL
ncbi:E3 ubiquitin-protein ligase Rnf220-like isoform X2 [Protopterus annectens]|uniref:E3 ubiquitin-protein ligase Rnf220-like isoform X2 n=1 Tax=Protopterus annectens TaxID=7888 RepID=UPI001CF9E6F8|nr:E3 ubiquitin-protein ligase Rnf220-like isoform X2 [Protopterus annectens]